MSEIKHECERLSSTLNDMLSEYNAANDAYIAKIKSFKEQYVDKAICYLKSIESNCDASIKVKCNQFVTNSAIRLQQIYDYMSINGDFDVVTKRFNRLISEVDQFIQKLSS